MEDCKQEPAIEVNELRENREVERPVREPYTDLELLKNHNVTFRFADAGCTISIGCKTYCFSDNIVASEEFSKYVKNPSEAYKKWSK